MSTEGHSEIGPVKIDRSTLVPIGVVCTVVLAAVSAWGFADSRFTNIDDALHRQDRRLEKLEDAAGDRWSATTMKLWVSEFRRLNPELQVPE